ncbi:hypothetical protein [Hungatella hathewayi]
MRKEMYEVRRPIQIRFGDPMYFERFTGKELSELVVDFSPPAYFAARLILEEKEIEECPGFIDRTMQLYLAPEKIIKTYMDGFMYEGQKQDGMAIGVDTARYLFDVDGRSEVIKTGADGYWGSYETFHGNHKGIQVLDAAIITVAMPEFVNFEGMKQMASYFFHEMQPVEGLEQSDGQQMKIE